MRFKLLVYASLFIFFFTLTVGGYIYVNNSTNSWPDNPQYLGQKYTYGFSNDKFSGELTFTGIVEKTKPLGNSLEMTLKTSPSLFPWKNKYVFVIDRPHTSYTTQENESQGEFTWNTPDLENFSTNLPSGTVVSIQFGENLTDLDNLPVVPRLIIHKYLR